MSKLDQKVLDDKEPTPVHSAPAQVSRRVLLGGSVGALALIAAACGDDDGVGAGGDAATSSTSPSGSTTTAAGEEGSSTTAAGEEGASGDLAVAMTAAGLEVLAVGTYGAALDAAGSGALGDVPPAVAEFVTTAQGHHQAHLDAWNEVLTGAGMEAVSEPPADLKATIDEAFAQVTDVTGAARLALTLEQTAADTYLAVIPTLADAAAIGLAASIQPIDMQHVAVLLFVLGEYPVPNTFANTDNAYAG